MKWGPPEGIIPESEEAGGLASAFPPCEDPARKQPSLNQQNALGEPSTPAPDPRLLAPKSVLFEWPVNSDF